MGIRNIHVWELLPWDIQVDILSRLSTKDLREVESVCKDWQCIIESPRFHMLQVNANPNQDAIIMNFMNYLRKFAIQSLSFSDIYKFVNPKVDSASYHKYNTILAVSNGLVLINSNFQFDQLLVYNPIIEEYVKLPQLRVQNFSSKIACDFFEHDLQSSTYKIFVASNKEIHIYSSSSHFWQTFNDSFSSFTSSLKYKLWSPDSCITYKNNIYIAFNTSIEWMILAKYNPTNDKWNNFNVDILRYYPSPNEGRLIIANDCLFFASVNCFRINRHGIYNSIVIFELNIENRLFIQIKRIDEPIELQYNWVLPSHCIFGIGNKITIIGYKKDIVITFDISTNKQEETRYNDNGLVLEHERIYPFKYTSVSP